METMLGPIEFSPLLPIWALIVLGLLLILPAVIRPRLKMRGRFLRLSLAAWLILILIRPVWLDIEKEETPDTALLIIDESASQTLTSRLEKTRQIADQITDPLTTPNGINWRKVIVGDDARNEGTALFSTLRNAVNSISVNDLTGVVILSDGIAHDQAISAELESLNIPVHSLIVGDKNLTDRRLVIEKAPQFGLVGKSVDIEFRIDDGKDASRDIVAVTYRLNDGQDVSINARVGRRETLRIQPEHRGQNILHLKVEALDNEVSLINNETVLSISGVRDRLRVVLISGEPYQGERAWRTTLKSDPAVDLVHFTILRLPTSQDFTPVQELALIPFPSRQLFEEKLNEFDLVIFDRYTLRGVLQNRYLANLASYVNGGGAVLISVGPEFSQALSLANTPLSAILPAQPTGFVYDQPFRPALSDTGKRHPVTAALPRLWGSERPWGQWQRFSEARVIDGQVLMTGPDAQPLLVLNHTGEGRVALLLSDQSWLWGKNIDGGGPQGELVRRLAHWLMKEPDLAEESLTATAQDQRLSITRQSISVEGGNVDVESPLGTTESLALTPIGEGKSSAQIDVDTPGLYTIRSGELSTFVVAGALNSLEFSELRASDERLRPLSDATRGGVYWAEDGIPTIRRTRQSANQAGRSWIGLPRNEAGRVLQITQIRLIPNWFALFIGIALLTLIWFRESR